MAFWWCRWRGKVALVTGASAGIGWRVCEALALAGLRVVAVARRRERLESLQQMLVGKGVPIADFLPVVCDITKVWHVPDVIREGVVCVSQSV
jgi:NADP-dependent 3-hydroxy acid dehydrogenase YdfG